MSGAGTTTSPQHHHNIPGAADGAIAINTDAKELLDNGKIRARIRELETVHHGNIAGTIGELQAGAQTAATPRD